MRAKFLPAYQQATKPIEPTMTALHHPVLCLLTVQSL